MSSERRNRIYGQGHTPRSIDSEVIDRIHDAVGEALTDRHAEDDPCVERSAARDQPPHEAPVLGAAALDPAGAESDVGSVLADGDQAGHVGGVVGEVAVHLEHEPRIGRLQHAREPGEVRASDPLFPGPVEHLEPGQLGREAIGDLPRPVRRAVVDHEHPVAREVERLAERPHERLDVLALVVIHDVEHPHEVEHAPQLMAPGQKLASNGREIEGGSIPMIELDAPQRWLSTPDFPRHICDEFGRCDRLGPGIIGRSQGSDCLLVWCFQRCGRGRSECALPEGPSVT